MWETGRGNGEGRWTEDIEAAHFNNRNNPSLYFKHFFFFFFGFLSAAPFGLRDLSSLAGTEPREHGSEITEFQPLEIPHLYFKNIF